VADRYEDLEPYVPSKNIYLPEAFLFDIDGTLALRGDRGPFDYDRVEEDAVNEAVRVVLYALSGAGYRPVLMSGRPERARALTERWLRDRVGVPYDGLLMRADGDNRPDWVVKHELFVERVSPNYVVHGVFDDRNQVVGMWRAIGLPCFQVAEGDF